MPLHRGIPLEHVTECFNVLHRSFALPKMGEQDVRARNIKPGFFKNPDLADAGPAIQLLFAGLWCLADREGRIKDSPRVIKAEIFPYYDMDVNGGLTVLERIGLLRRYAADGVAVIEITNFAKHQSPHHTEKASELPAFRDLTVNSRKSNGGNPSDSLIPDSLIPDSPNHELVVAGIPIDHREIFDEIQRRYPKGLHRSDHWTNAEHHVARLLDDVRADVLLTAVAAYADQQTAMGTIGTGAVMRPNNFFGTKAWLGPFPLPTTKAETKRDANIDASLKWLENSNAG